VGGDWSGDRRISTVGATDEEGVGRSIGAGAGEFTAFYGVGGGGRVVYGVREGGREGG